VLCLLYPSAFRPSSLEISPRLQAAAIHPMALLDSSTACNLKLMVMSR